MSPRKGWHLICFMEEMKYCAFIGQKEITVTDELCKAITSEILWHFDHGYKIFLFGSSGSFEKACCNILKSVIPCSDAKAMCWVSENLPQNHPDYPRSEDYDGIFRIPTSHSRHESVRSGNLAMLLVYTSSSIVFCTEESADSEIYEAYEYAKTQSSKRVVNLYMQSK